MEIKLLTEQEVAELMKCSLAKLQKDRHLRKGIPFVKHGSQVRYKLTDISKFIEHNTYHPR